jgi:hypothetical protein
MESQLKREVAVDATHDFGITHSHENANILADAIRQQVQERYDAGYNLDGIIPDIGSDDSHYPYAFLIFSRPQPTEIDDAYEVRPVTRPRKDKS